MVHDAARPFITTCTIDEIIDLLDEKNVVDLSVQPVDTIRKQDSMELIDRDTLLCAQTPQGFQYETLKQLHAEAADNTATDCISLAVEEGLEVITILGNNENFKITTNSDLKRAKLMIENDFEIRMGHGYDTHALEHSNVEESIALGGLQIPFDKKLIAHSDGDVILHSLMDAILGALGLGDIGKIFPPTDEKWKDANSIHLLEIIRDYMKDSNCDVVNIDITLIAEAPKIGLIRRKMEDTIANTLKIDNKRVNIKATTNEKNGFYR